MRIYFQNQNGTILQTLEIIIYEFIDDNFEGLENGAVLILEIYSH